jgi:hypothetical protein
MDFGLQITFLFSSRDSRHSTLFNFILLTICSFAWEHVQILIDILLRQILADFHSRTGVCPDIDGESFDARLTRARNQFAEFDRYKQGIHSVGCIFKLNIFIMQHL